MPTLYEMSKCGRAAVASLAATGYNSNVTYNGSAVSDLDVNVIYGVVKLIGGAAGQTLVLPSVQSNWCYIANQSSQDVAIKSSQSDPSPETVAATESAVVFFDGTRYRKLTAAINPIDIGAFSSVGAPAGTDLLWTKTGAGNQKLTLAQLVSYVSANVTIPSQVVLQPVDLVYTSGDLIIWPYTGLSNINQDGVVPSAGQRVLVADDDVNAGIWIASAGAWTRASDMPAGAVISSAIVPAVRLISSPNSHGGSVWMSTSGTIDVDAVYFYPISMDFSNSDDLQSKSDPDTGGAYANNLLVRQISGDRHSRVAVVTANQVRFTETSAPIVTAPDNNVVALEAVDNGYTNGTVLAQHNQIYGGRSVRTNPIGFEETLSYSGAVTVSPTFNICKFDSWWNVASGRIDVTLINSLGGATQFSCVFTANNIATKGAYLTATTTAAAMGDGSTSGSTTGFGAFLDVPMFIGIDASNILYVTIKTTSSVATVHKAELLISGSVTMGHSTIASFA